MLKQIKWTSVDTAFPPTVIMHLFQIVFKGNGFYTSNKHRIAVSFEGRGMVENGHGIAFHFSS